MQSRDNPYEQADIAFIREELRLAQELAKRHVEFVVVPLVTQGDAEARTLVSISGHLRRSFLLNEHTATTDENATSGGRG